MLEGAAVDLYKEMLEELPGIVLTASGGIGSLADVESLDAVGGAVGDCGQGDL